MLKLAKTSPRVRVPEVEEDPPKETVDVHTENQSPVRSTLSYDQKASSQVFPKSEKF